MKPKIYFAKTNSCDSKDVAAVRNCLNKLNVEVLEYDSGSPYNAAEQAKLDSAEYMVVLTPDFTGDVGKGVYTQVERFVEKYDKESVYIVTDIDGRKEVAVASLDSMDESDGADWKKYGWLESVCDEEKLSDIFEAKTDEPVTTKVPGRVWKDGTQFTIAIEKNVTVYTIRKNTKGTGNYVYWGKDDSDKCHYDDSSLDRCFARPGDWIIVNSNPTNPFKVGDLVKFVKSKCKNSFYDRAIEFSSDLTDGGLYRITEIASNGKSHIKEWKNNFIHLATQDYGHAFDCFEPVVTAKVRTEAIEKTGPVKAEKVDKLLKKLEPEEAEKIAARKAVYDVEVTPSHRGDIYIKEYSVYSYTPPVSASYIKVEVKVEPLAFDNMMMLLIG
jgi:hypothetical protein